MQFAISSAVITACTMNSLFLYSDKSLVFTYFVFGLSAVMLSFLISTFFSRAKTAVAVGTLSFLGAFFPYYSVNDPAVPMLVSLLLLLWLFSKICFPQEMLLQIVSCVLRSGYGRFWLLCYHPLPLLSAQLILLIMNVLMLVFVGPIFGRLQLY